MLTKRCVANCAPGHSCIPLAKNESTCIDLSCPAEYEMVQLIDLCRATRGQRFWKRDVVLLPAGCLKKNGNRTIYVFPKEDTPLSAGVRIVGSNAYRVDESFFNLTETSPFSLQILRPIEANTDLQIEVRFIYPNSSRLYNLDLFIRP